MIRARTSFVNSVNKNPGIHTHYGCSVNKCEARLSFGWMNRSLKKKVVKFMRQSILRITGQVLTILIVG